MKSKVLIVIACLFVCVTSCVKDKPQEPKKTAVTINANSKVLVVNEGGYGWGNASISLYDPSSYTVIDNYYTQQNSSSLGDVCQSITKHNNNYYIVMNNSNKIIVANASDLIKTATINGFNSPRNIVAVTHNKAYVSDLYANSIQIVNFNTNSITGSIPCLSGTEQMVLIYNKVVVTNFKSNYCYIINTLTDAITDSVFVGKGAASIVIDKHDKVWILASGDPMVSAGKLVCLNPISQQVELSLNFSLGDEPKRLCINKTLDTLYYLNNGVNQMPIINSQLPTNPIISSGNKTYYGLGINPKNYSIYVADAIDYLQKSKIEIYTPTGNLKNSFNAGIISNGFVFD